MSHLCEKNYSEFTKKVKLIEKVNNIEKKKEEYSSNNGEK